ncbi:hypothetical protein [Ancylomarina longa]|uniref:Permease n=1 Tax=Ancylomarina longa TaxID=2487017 RepID=A0A434AY04_9BACT|nr:hypothetical protein [Ancylomarina longa]RUT79319.1 hypothetical protein DLK05_03605 [Ancylomarina longa]
MKENMGKIKKSKNTLTKWYFFILVLLIYSSISVFSPDKIMPILHSFIQILIQIIPVFLIVYFILFLTNLYINNKILQKYMGEDAGIKGWIISIIAGIISMGSIYAWYPLLKDLQSKGVKNKFIVTFLYNRGIKLQWLPVLILYFGWVYSITLLIVMAILSVFQGIITEKLISLSNASSD